MEDFGLHHVVGFLFTHYIIIKLIKIIMISKKLVCTQCGHVGDSKSKLKGSGLIELILWLFMIFPGIIYSIWRRSSKDIVCSVCGNKSLIPIDSPRAKKVMEETMTTAEAEKSIQSEKDNLEKAIKKDNKTRIIAIVAVIIFFTLIVIFSL